MGNFLNSSDSVFYKIETDKKISNLSNDINTKLNNISTETDNKLNAVIKNISELSSDIDTRLDNILNQTNDKIEQVNQNITNLSNDVNTRLNNISIETDNKISNLSSELKTEIENSKVKLYSKKGTNTDGAMTQAAATAALEEINNNFNVALGDIGSILDEINRVEV